MNATVTKVPVSPRVGLLATQGDYAMHRKVVESLGYDCAEVRTVGELAGVDCLIMPGGESTTMRKILKFDGLWEAIRMFASDHAIMGTCAGLILLGKGIVNARHDEDTLGLIDVDSDRNAYGRQYHSFRQLGDLRLSGAAGPLEMVFIRAPRITRVGGAVDVLGTLNGEPTLVREGNILALTFHPELSDDPTVHRFFIETMVKEVLAKSKSKAA